MATTLASPPTSSKDPNAMFSPTNTQLIPEPMTAAKLADVTNLIKECSVFVDTTKNSLAIPFAAFERVRQWRVKRRESKAMEVCDTLMPRIKDTENNLRFTITDTVERKAALREQAKFLLARLSTCIAFNQDNLNYLIPVVEDTRSIVISLSDALVTVKRMIAFNNEILRLRNVQNAGSRRGGGNNGYRNNMVNNLALFRPVSEDDLNRDNEYTPLLNRLNVLREVREKYVSLLSSILESRELFTVNYDNCNACFKQICDLLRLDKEPVYVAAAPTTPKAIRKEDPNSSTPVTATKRLSLAIQSVVGGSLLTGTPVAAPAPAAASVEVGDVSDIITHSCCDANGGGVIMIGTEVIPVYSHKDTCSDCACVVTITNDCILSFEEIHSVQVMATKQLSLLVEARERINEVLENVTPAGTPGGPPGRDSLNPSTAAGLVTPNKLDSLMESKEGSVSGVSDTASTESGSVTVSVETKS